MNYIVPDEDEFFIREFGLSDEHDPGACLFSFIYRHESGQDLIFTHSPLYNASVSVGLKDSKRTLFWHYQEGVSLVEFLGWGEDQIIRVSFKDTEKDLRISYRPYPGLHYSERLKD